MKMFKYITTTLLILLMFFLHNLGHTKLEIIIKPTPDWGPMSDADIEILCQNVVDHFEKHLRPENEIQDKVNVSRTNVGHHFVTLDTADPNVRYKIGIQPIQRDGIGYRITDFFYLIQPFTHEFCHILQDQTYKLFVEDTANLWLMEGIATMSSLWCLREMAKEWKNGSHFGVDFHQADGAVYNFSDSFNFWVDRWLNHTPQFQFDGISEEWLEKYEDDLRKISMKSHAGLYFVVPPEQLAFRFLPIFEKNPQAWNIIPKMPFTDSKMPEYMQEWYDLVDIQDKQHVEAIAKVMGITVTQPTITPIAIDADIDGNGYVDLYDVMLVRSAMTYPSTYYDTDINNDGVTDELDLLIVKMKAMEAIVLAAPGITRNRKMTTRSTSVKPHNKVITKWGSLKTR